MAATLTKITDGKPVVFDDLTNEQMVRCPRCEQTYRLGYSDSEWHRAKDWLKIVTIPLEWRGIRRR